jgi:hypothetical protein
MARGVGPAFRERGALLVSILPEATVAGTLKRSSLADPERKRRGTGHVCPVQEEGVQRAFADAEEEQ